MIRKDSNIKTSLKKLLNINCEKNTKFCEKEGMSFKSFSLAFNFISQSLSEYGEIKSINYRERMCLQSIYVFINSRQESFINMCHL